MEARKKDHVSDDTSDTIVAVITPPGEGGVAALRLAGAASLDILRKSFTPNTGKHDAIIPFMMRLGRLVDQSGDILDEVMTVYMPSGKSYTGLEQVEVFCHGGRHVVNRILGDMVARGARPAEPGEFTRLAFVNGRIDLAGAEAVAGIIAAGTETSYRASRDHLLGKYSAHVNQIRDELIALLAQIEASIDFVEEDIDLLDHDQLVLAADELAGKIGSLAGTYSGGKIIREGFKIAICGRPNAGKSSLFNLLLREERALVNPTPGTTRDYLSEWIDLDGYAVNLIDTAGLRRAGDELEKAGQDRTRNIIDEANLVIWMVDVSVSDWAATLKGSTEDCSQNVILLVGNKIDLGRPLTRSSHPGTMEMVAVSCLTTEGINRLKAEIVSRIDQNMPDLTEGLIVTSARHHQRLTEAERNIREASVKIDNRESAELTAFDLQQARTALDEITGRIYTEDLLGEIFASFCVGK